MRLALVLPLLAAVSIAQADVQPFEINMDRVTMAHQGSFGGSKTYIIPTGVCPPDGAHADRDREQGFERREREGEDPHGRVRQETGSGPRAEDPGRPGGEAQGSRIHRAHLCGHQGRTQGRRAQEGEREIRLPTDLLEGGKGIDFAIVTPTDEQSIDFGFTGVTWPYKAIAKQHNAVVLVPDLRFSITEVSGETSSNAFAASAKLNILPVMKLDLVTVTALEPNLAAGYFLIQQHGKRLAGENVGTIRKVSEDNNNYAGWSRTVGDYSFTINHPALNDSVLRVGYAVNDLTVATAKKAH